MPKVVPFFVLSLPRSRSWWLANLLADEVAVTHDRLVYVDTLDDFFAPFESGQVAGTCETAGVEGWRMIRQRLPQARVMVVRRGPTEVLQSLALKGWASDEITEQVFHRDTMLDACARAPGVLSVRFEGLGSRRTCNRIFEHCLGRRLGDTRWNHFRGLNLQIDLAARGGLLRSRTAEIAELKLELAQANAELGMCGGLH